MSKDDKSEIIIFAVLNFSFDDSLVLSFTLSINLLKPSSSIVKPFSCAITFVKSTGKPNVS